VHVEFLQSEGRHGTGSVQVTIDARGQAAYAFASDPAWDHLQWCSGLETLAGRCDAVCFGTLAQRSATTEDAIHKFLNATAPEALRVFDVNLRQNFYTREILLRSLAKANVLKLNHEELSVVQELLDLGGGSEEMLLSALGERFTLECIALTRGANGSLLWRRGEVHEQVPAPVEVVDTVGAGDSFTAALILGLLRDESLEVIHRRASGIASYVCGQRGATPELPYRLSRG
jgi:fructokinase